MDTINYLKGLKKPETKAEIIQILDEAIRIADHLHEQIDSMEAILNAKHESLLAA